MEFSGTSSATLALHGLNAATAKTPAVAGIEQGEGPRIGAGIRSGISEQHVPADVRRRRRRRPDGRQRRHRRLAVISHRRICEVVCEIGRRRHRRSRLQRFAGAAGSERQAMSAAPEPSDRGSDAQQIVGNLLTIMDALVATVEQETQLVRSGQLNQASELVKTKSELTSRYLSDSAWLKANARGDCAGFPKGSEIAAPASREIPRAFANQLWRCLPRRTPCLKESSVARRANSRAAMGRRPMAPRDARSAARRDRRHPSPSAEPYDCRCRSNRIESGKFALRTSL